MLGKKEKKISGSFAIPPAIRYLATTELLSDVFIFWAAYDDVIKKRRK